MNETELLLAFRKERSEEAFAELVRRYANLVYSVAKRRLANAALAEDITQIVFIRLAKSPPKVENHGQLVAWLHRTTINITIDTWRSEPPANPRTAGHRYGSRHFWKSCVGRTIAPPGRSAKSIE